ncbi:HAD-IA family hydrolase [Bacillus sp. NPDC094106]|uniref:HAD-IA family hydrolase n=1 Tax=Bacillus sp. NPDC094106 TaxID=3363949 RepID=UPI0037F78360
MQQAVIFDMDGTLFQTNLILEPALVETFDVLRAEGLWNEETPIEKYREIMGVPLQVVWETLCPNHSLQVREKSNDTFHEKLIELIKLNRGALYPYTVEVLERLSQNYNLYIASNGQVEYLQAIVDTYELNRFIKKVYSIQSISSGHKSDLVKNVVEENNIVKGTVVGDRLSDINAAKDNGLKAIGVNFDFAQVMELEKADKVIDNLKELTALL